MHCLNTINGPIESENGLDQIADCQLYIRVTVLHRNIFLFNNQSDALIIQISSAIKLYMFGHLLCPSSGVFYCTFDTGKFHAGLMTVSKLTVPS